MTILNNSGLSSDLPLIIQKNFKTIFALLLHPSRCHALHKKLKKSHRGAPSVLCLWQLLASMVYHVLQPSGTLSEHVFALTKHKMAESSLSQRRQNLGSNFFNLLLQIILRPLATPDQAACFYKGLRLVGIDGTQWSISNTPQVKHKRRKTKSRRSLAAFAKISLCALYELGTHNPLAASIGMDGQSETMLASSLIESLQCQWLLIADRYYGCQKWIAHLISVNPHSKFLIRVKKNLKSKILYSLPDGSFLIECYDHTSKSYITLREIHAKIKPRTGKHFYVRFWTNLQDFSIYPAEELVLLYGKRWEQECAYKELKISMRRSDLLLSHTLVSAAQEIACLLIAQSVVAQARVSCAIKFECQALDISFIKTLHALHSLFWCNNLIGDLIPHEKRSIVIQRLFAALFDQKSKKRRQRSCPRAVRQPVSSWPRLIKNLYQKGRISCEIIAKPS